MENSNNTMPQQELEPGKMLWHNSYKIIRVLGQGGFGITYLAMDENLGREVCIKEFFPKEFCGRDDTSHLTVASKSAEDLINRMKDKFVKEARNIVRFNHPNIIKVHTAFEENNTAYYVMDYIEGESLSSMVKRNGPLSPSIAKQYIDQIGDALEYIHRHHINHLDVKPANIMIDSTDNRPVLIDFGLAKQYDTQGNQTSTTPVGLSHGFAPIEQYKSGGVSSFSPQSDLYSLAATFYYILTATVPPEAALLASDPLSFPASFPSQYIEPVKRAMAVGRNSRQETVGQFLRELNSTPSDHTQVIADHTQVVADDRTRVVAGHGPSNANHINNGPHYQQPVQQPVHHQPTQVIDTPYTGPMQPEKPKKSWMMPALILGGSLIVAVVLLIVFLNGDKKSATAENEGNIFVENSEVKEEKPVRQLNLSVNDAPHLAPQAGNYYMASNLIDGKKNTAWICDAGAYNGPDGIDVLEFKLNAEKIDHIVFTNGYIKNSKVYYNNARAGSITISRVPVDLATPSDILFSGPVADSMSPQTLPVSPNYDNTIPTEELYVRFGPDIIHGSKYYNDFCISEFQVFGY